MKLTEHLTPSSVAALSHSSKLDGLRLSPHFTLEEMTKTSVRGVDNTPSGEVVENLKRLCGWLEMLRSEYNSRYGCLADSAENAESAKHEAPIIINSGYRSPEVNKAVGGATQSNHLTGCAVDIRACGLEQALRYATILLDISHDSQEAFDELIIERKGYTVWVHFAVRPQGNRGRVMCY